MLLLTCVLVFSACGHQQKQSSILNPTSEQLDSLENIVLNSPDAQLRSEARMSAIDLLYYAPDQESVQSLQQKCLDVFLSWYVQLWTDSTDSQPIIMMSYSFPWDTRGFQTHVGLTFSQAPNAIPVLIISLPGNAYVTEHTSPLVYFEQNIAEDIPSESQIYSSVDNNLELFGNNDDGNILALLGQFLDDMLKYNAVRIIFMNDNAKKYDNLSDANSDECVTQVVVRLERIHQQYSEAYTWLIKQ